MIIIHTMNNRTPLPRYLLRALTDRLAVMPAVIVSGARQTGKSTLVQELLGGDRAWITLDDLDTLHMLRQNPDALLSRSAPLTIDEVQRAPQVFASIKKAIDEDRRPGRFLLTGSANLLMMDKVSESLAGRAVYLHLRPMTRGEQRGRASCGCWDAFFALPPEKWEQALRDHGATEEPWEPLALRGGFPTPAVHLSTQSERAIWFDGYIQTYLERDLGQLSNISSLPDFRRLMRAACHRSGQILNQTELGRDVGLPQPTVHRYMNLLEVSQLLIRLPAWSVNRTKRLIKSPKVFWGDVGLSLHLADSDTPSGHHFENLVLLDILTWLDARTGTGAVHYWRTVRGDEVDFVIETSAGLLPIEVKSTDRPRLAHTTGITTFRSEYGSRALPGLLLHGGNTTEWLSRDVLSVPWWRVV